jgi:hypothetical protein
MDGLGSQIVAAGVLNARALAEARKDYAAYVSTDLERQVLLIRTAEGKIGNR